MDSSHRVMNKFATLGENLAPHGQTHDLERKLSITPEVVFGEAEF